MCYLFCIILIGNRRTKKYKTKKSKILPRLYKDLSVLYNMIEVEQEALDLCYLNGRDYGHITCIISVILEKFERVLIEFENLLSRQK